MKKIILTVALLLITLISNAQNDWIQYSITDGLINDAVNCITIDSQGNKWFGTQGGISKFDGSTWTNYTQINGLVNNNVFSIAIDSQGNKWFGAAGGVSKFDGTTWTNYTTIDGLVNNNVISIAIDVQGNKWFGTDGGVSKFNGTTWTNYTRLNGLADNHVSSIIIDSQGNKWFGTTAFGVSKFNGTTWTNYTTNSGLAHDGVNSIVIDSQGNKWFGTRSGVSKFDGNTWTNYTTVNGLGNNCVNSITIDSQGNKWFGTQGGGVTKFDGTIFTNYTLKNGVIIDNVYSITIDSQENKWCGTGLGVYLLCKSPPTVNITPITNSTICPGSPIQLTLTSNSGSIYKWSEIDPDNQLGSTQSITTNVNQRLTGFNHFAVKVSDAYGCQNSDTIDIIVPMPPLQHQVCLVTNSNNKNKIVWEKTNTNRVVKYKIYKQNNITSNYDFIHEQTASDLSEYLDTSSTPNIQIARYKLSVVDSCNNESPLSDNHTTILLSSNLGTNNTVNLNWNAYEGFVYSNFEIWRSLDGVNYTLLSTVANNTFSYIDVNPNTQGYYQIRITNPNGCTSSKSSFSTASSNIIDKSGHAAGLTENSLDALVSFFPNPTKGSFKITSSLDIINSIQVFDNLGKIVYSNHEISNEKDHSIDLFNCTEGIYTVKVISDSKIITSKIALQR